MNQEQLKGMLGSRYQYRRILTSGEVLHLQKENPPWFTGQIAASLIAGCVRLDAVLFRDGNALRLGYDLFAVSYTHLTRLVSPAEERKILQAADKANRFRSGSTDIREMVEAQSNLEDVASMIRAAQRNREPFFHTAVYIELIAKSEQEFTELRDGIEAELGRADVYKRQR